MVSRPAGMREMALLLASLLVVVGASECYLRRHPTEPVYMATRHIIQQEASEPGPGADLDYVPRARSVTPFVNLEFATTVRINALNMRDRDYPLAKRPGTRRIVAVGDSFVFGWGVEVEESVTKLLEHRYLTSSEVLNLGVPGYCGNQELAWLEARGLAFQPDLVLFFTWGPPERCADKFVFKDGRLYWDEALARPRVKRMKDWLTRRVYLMALADSAWPRRAVPAPPASWDDGIVDDLATLTRTRGVSAVVVYFSDEPAPAAFVAACRDRGLGYLDISEAVREHAFRLDGHWNHAGHDHAARAIAAYLAHQGGS